MGSRTGSEACDVMTRERSIRAPWPSNLPDRGVVLTFRENDTGLLDVSLKFPISCNHSIGQVVATTTTCPDCSKEHPASLSQFHWIDPSACRT